MLHYITTICNRLRQSRQKQSASALQIEILITKTKKRNEKTKKSCKVHKCLCIKIQNTETHNNRLLFLVQFYWLLMSRCRLFSFSFVFIACMSVCDCEYICFMSFNWPFSYNLCHALWSPSDLLPSYGNIPSRRQRIDAKWWRKSSGVCFKCMGFCECVSFWSLVYAKMHHLDGLLLKWHEACE